MNSASVLDKTTRSYNRSTLPLSASARDKMLPWVSSHALLDLAYAIIIMFSCAKNALKAALKEKFISVV
jgi:hypothetical protein